MTIKTDASKKSSVCCQRTSLKRQEAACAIGATDDDRRLRAKQYWPATLCVGWPVIILCIAHVLIHPIGATPCHRLRGSASPVLTATGFVNGKGQFSTPDSIDTPQPITKKFVTGDYVGDPYGCAKLGAYPYTGGFWAHG